MLTSHQKAVVRESFGRLAPICLAVADLFYDRLFALDPSLRPLFSGDMIEQRRKLTTMLAVAVDNLDRVQRIVPAVAALGQRHVAYGVQPEHYDTVGEAFVWSLERCLGPDFNAEAREAWAAMYLLITT